MFFLENTNTGDFELVVNSSALDVKADFSYKEGVDHLHL